MPKEYTHWFIADNIRLRLSGGPVSEAIDRNLPLYFLGAVIPDTPYYSLKSKAPAEAADSLHDSDSDIFHGGQALLEAAAGNWSEKAAVFLMGVYAHLFADAVFHPLVYYYSGIRNNIRHRRFESLLDLLFRKNPAHSLPLDMMSLVRTIEPEERNILGWIESLLSPYGKMNRADIKRLLHSHGQFHRRFLSRHWHILFRMIGLIPLNGVKQIEALFYPRRDPRFPVPETAVPFLHPVTGESLSYSLREFLDVIWDRFGVLAALFQEHFQKPHFLALALKEFPVVNLTTGLSGRRTEEMRYFDLSRPVTECFAPFFKLDRE